MIGSTAVRLSPGAGPLVLRAVKFLRGALGNREDGVHVAQSTKPAKESAAELTPPIHNIWQLLDRTPVTSLSRSVRRRIRRHRVLYIPAPARGSTDDK